MNRINIAWLMETFSTANELSNYWTRHTYSLSRSRDALDLIISQNFFRGKLRASYSRSLEIIDLIDKAIEDADSQPRKEVESNFFGREVSERSLGVIRTKWGELKPILTTEVGVMPTYFVTSISAYDTDALIEKGETLFPDSLLTLIPSAQEDAKMAGNALVFRMPTSCAFHIFRILEAVAREYFRTVEPSIEKPRTLGWISRELDTKGLGDERVAFALTNLTAQFRNPIFHPDVSITQDEAELLVGLANSVLVPMLSEIKSSNSTDLTK